MPGSTGYQMLLHALRKTAASAPQAFLTELQAAYGLVHVLYADLRREGGAFVPRKLIHGDDPDLERLIADEGLGVLYPLFETAANLFGPSVLNPADVATAAAGAERPHRVCQIDQRLLVFPLVPSRPGVAFFACDPGDLGDATRNTEWLLRDLAALAGLFHATQLPASATSPRSPPGKPDAPRLTPREREVLQWVAEGKTYWEIAHILGISERTVRHFMAACREKLDAVSNKQAVAKAVAGRLIDVR